MTPSAARKLKHLQMSRGDLSSAAEHAQEFDPRITGRARSDSNPRIENGRAVGLNVNVGGWPLSSSSAHTTPFMTPAGPLSPRTPRATRSSNVDRHVRFSSPRHRSLSPPARRVGTSSSFTLYLPEPNDEDTALPSESEESDASGKDGEKPVTKPGLLSRLRRLSETGRSPTKATTQEETGAEQDGTLMYIEPGSPQLQVPDLNEPPLQNMPHTFLSHRTRRAGRDGHVSPYHANNPYFGYPAYIDSSAASASAATSGQYSQMSATSASSVQQQGGFSLSSYAAATPRHLHVRRRKRDLLRTLTYLFVLRILALHRRVRWRVALVWREVVRTLSVGGRPGLTSTDDGDDFWRTLRSRRPSRTLADASDAKLSSNRGKSAMHMWTRVSTAVLFVMLVRPQWRQRVVTRVYTMLAPIVLRNADDASREPVNWDEWERQGAKLTAPLPAPSSKEESWTGLHLRQRLGFGVKPTPVQVAAGSGGRPGRSSGQRYNPMAVAGGVFAAASLSYLLYSYLSSSAPLGQKDDDDDVARRNGGRDLAGTGARKPNRNRPSMSLCLSTSFDRSNARSMAGLHGLLERLSPLFVVHLIVPGNAEVELSQSIASLAATLDDVDDFDTRRILEYTQLSGRFALSRALACDCHVEVSLPTADESGTTVELEKIRRSCGLVVFAVLISHDDTTTTTTTTTGAQTGIDAQTTRVLEQLRTLAADAGQPTLDAPPGMRAYTSASWSHLADQLSALRQGWN